MHCQLKEFYPPHQLWKNCGHLIFDELVELEKILINDLIVSHKLGHCNLFSDKSLKRILYNNHDQFYIILFFVVPKNSICLKLVVFTCTFLQNKVFFIFHIERNQPPPPPPAPTTTTITIIYHLYILCYLGPILLTWIHFNLSRDEL